MGHYIDKDELRREVETSQSAGECSDRLAVMMYLLADHVLDFRQFKNYAEDVKEDMKQYAVSRICTRGYKTAKPDGNLFAYFTTAVFSNFQCFLETYYNRLNRLRRAKLAILDRAPQTDIVRQQALILQQWDDRRAAWSEEKIKED